MLIPPAAAGSNLCGSMFAGRPELIPHASAAIARQKSRSSNTAGHPLRQEISSRTITARPPARPSAQTSSRIRPPQRRRHRLSPFVDASSSGLPDARRRGLRLIVCRTQPGRRPTFRRAKVWRRGVRAKYLAISWSAAARGRSQRVSEGASASMSATGDVRGAMPPLLRPSAALGPVRGITPRLGGTEQFRILNQDPPLPFLPPYDQPPESSRPPSLGFPWLCGTPGGDDLDTLQKSRPVHYAEPSAVLDQLLERKPHSIFVPAPAISDRPFHVAVSPATRSRRSGARGRPD